MLDGRVALITGSSRGIGLAIGRELARAGAHVMLNCDRSVGEVQAAVEVRERGEELAHARTWRQTKSATRARISAAMR